jgi:hypothetical protein
MTAGVTGTTSHERGFIEFACVPQSLFLSAVLWWKKVIAVRRKGGISQLPIGTGSRPVEARIRRAAPDELGLVVLADVERTSGWATETERAEAVWHRSG